MGYSAELFNAAMATVKNRRARAELAADERHDAYRATHPEYAKLERELSRTGLRLVRAIFNQSESAPDIGTIRDSNLALQQKINELLAADGLSPNAFDPQYTCALCCDTGIKGNEVCDCVRQLMKQSAYERLNSMTPLSNCTFENFSLEHYPDTSDDPRLPSARRVMAKTFDTCRNYANSFSLSSPNLLLLGGVGLGKTHLSLAIASTVIERGFDVVYGSAHTLFGKIEREKFGRSNSDEDTLELLNSCELLIIDDLGVEFVSSFTVSTLYDIVNSRLLAARPTIINTNLNIDGLEQRYSERLVSRLTGAYMRVPFIGKDLRIVLKRSRSANPQN